MILNKEQDVAFMKGIASRSFATSIFVDYGDQGVLCLTQITTAISNLYKYINLQEHFNITVFKSISPCNKLSGMFPGAAIKVTDYSYFSTRSSTNFTIEVVDENELYVVYDQNITISEITTSAVVYQYENGKEHVHGKTSITTLDKPPDINSYFAFPTFKHLDSALQCYYLVRARLSSCHYLENAWLSDRKIFFSPRPEAKMRKSLYDFLAITVRGEVREEQNVNDSEPVDIKVTWDFSNHIALIEIKWLGKSIEQTGVGNFKQVYGEARANSGAKQLADYLDENKQYTPRNVTVGYLIVFDGRRWQTNIHTTEINRQNGFYYESQELVYNPDYNSERVDFAKPIRFFMEPRVTN